MCFGAPPKQPKAAPIPQVQVPQPTPIQQQVPTIQSGADVSNQQAKPLKNKSLFQVDLSTPLGPNTGGTTAGANLPPGQ